MACTGCIAVFFSPFQEVVGVGQSARLDLMTLRIVSGNAGHHRKMPGISVTRGSIAITVNNFRRSSQDLLPSGIKKIGVKRFVK